MTLGSQTQIGHIRYSAPVEENKKYRQKRRMEEGEGERERGERGRERGREKDRERREGERERRGGKREGEG